MTRARPDDLQRGTSAVVIAKTIRNDIEAGRLVHEQQLKSTRELAAEWNTSVATITRAMALLADEGLVISKDRSSRVVNFPPEQPEHVKAERPQVVLIGGYAGSGKTELGRIIARRTRWPILDKDSTTRAVVEAALEALGCSPHDREGQTYLEIIRPAEYEALMVATSENVECGVSVVVTAPFIRELADQAWCDRTRARLESMGADLHVVWVRCDEESMKRYIKHRGAARDAHKLATWADYMNQVDLDFKPATRHQIINNSIGCPPLQQQAAELLNKVAR